MAESLRKPLTFEVCDKEITVEVDFRFIECMERVFGDSADNLLPLFVDISKVQRRHTADVVAEMIGRKALTDIKRSKVREYVITSPPDVYFAFVTQLQIALLYILRHIPGAEFDQGIAALSEAKKKTDQEDS